MPPVPPTSTYQQAHYLRQKSTTQLAALVVMINDSYLSTGPSMFMPQNKRLKSQANLGSAQEFMKWRTVHHLNEFNGERTTDYCINK
jgi:hypothetical protein